MRASTDDAAGGVDETDEALTCFGLTRTEPDSPPAGPDIEVCEVWPWHWNALRLFLACQGQLELCLGMGGVVYAGARATNVAQELQWLGVPRKAHAEVVGQYRVIEREALTLLNARQSA